MQQRVDEFNQDFWTRNNLMFLQAKAEYEEQCKLPIRKKICMMESS